ncbi:S-methyl-5-thioribose kinase [Phytobacter diazotrophicus]|jgi:5-methylthioribose kinase|uniref:S-methyl-5-thioribose kinase n=1 Tax=Enterobacteriaceae TaxID=543 RepID=UPI0005A46513|nr:MULTISPECIES: S-methyl-5-thioribose kinase [Enterobacteriaceae]MBS6737239.1 S-methyl-5-thioribose kinase [Enterobacteriaceae bacterium]PXW54287.1 5'-methylthioribose kinase [Grimontella sp. AG753]QIH64639.1 S-methyl-5-thioribose kinase [Enterobacteriaceae bacterium A-F18]SLK17908.1 5'-methylthioribose kinase [Enterobacter sp. NFR05]MDU4354808.1 S-methyl-5-thioribose kinase [Phytobacter diazotrophicus]
MSQYRTFNAQDAVAYAQQFGGLDTPSELVEAQEVGDGNLNLVFKIFDSQGVSRIIVKQALPYVRCVGESWPLTLDRARLEAQTLVEHYKHAPQHTVNILHYDPELAVMVMEDLSDHRIWRSELIKNVYYPQAARQLGEYLAQTLFHTSDFYLHPHVKKAQVAQFINPEMCEITEDLFFNDPYQVHERNNYPAALEADVDALRQDTQLKLAVASLKHSFFSHAEALLHGDIHSGSIFVAEGSLKAIDAEFGYFGPIGFDIGTAIGNLLLNYCGLPGHLGIRDAAAAREQRLKDIQELWSTFAERFQALAREKTQDAALSVPGYASEFLKKVWTDAVGFCGTELIRRSVGLSHVADIDTIADEEMRHECLRHAIALGKVLIVIAPRIDSVDELIARVRQYS